MDDKEQTRKTSKALVVCTYPDVCKSPVAPVPYQIVAIFEPSRDLAYSVNATSQPTFTKASYIEGVIGDEGGTGQGVKSGTHAGGGTSRAIEWSDSVRAEGQLIVRNDDKFDMNGPPKGPHNTQGKAVFPDKGGAPGGVDENGKPKQDTNPDGRSWYQKAWDQAQSLVKQAQDLYKQLDDQYQIGTRFGGAMQMYKGYQSAAAGVGLASIPSPGGITQLGGLLLFLYGIDQGYAGFQTLMSGQQASTILEQAVGKNFSEVLDSLKDLLDPPKAPKDKAGKIKDTLKKEGTRISGEKKKEEEKKDEKPQEKPEEKPAEAPAEKPAEAPAPPAPASPGPAPVPNIEGVPMS